MFKIKKQTIIVISIILIIVLISIFVINIINNLKLKEEFKTSTFVEFSDFKKVKKLMNTYQDAMVDDEVNFFNSLNNNSKIFYLFAVTDVTEQKYSNNKYLYTFKSTVYPDYKNYNEDNNLDKYFSNSKELTSTYEGEKIEDKYLDKVNNDNEMFIFYGFGTYTGNYNISLDYIFYNLIDE